MKDARKKPHATPKPFMKAARWLNIALYPELARFPTEEEREAALYAVASIHGRTWQYPVMIAATLGGGLVLGVLAAEGLRRLDMLSFLPRPLILVVSTFGGVAAGMTVAARYYIPRTGANCVACSQRTARRFASHAATTSPAM